MNFWQYQERSRETAMYVEKIRKEVRSKKLRRIFGVTYATLGLTGETGEVAEKIKKIIRDKQFVISKESKQMLVFELGDVLWYLAQLCTELDIDMEEVAGANINKLQSRKKRGKLSGSGDKR